MRVADDHFQNISEWEWVDEPKWIAGILIATIERVLVKFMILTIKAVKTNLTIYEIFYL